MLSGLKRLARGPIDLENYLTEAEAIIGIAKLMFVKLEMTAGAEGNSILAIFSPLGGLGSVKFTKLKSVLEGNPGRVKFF